MKIPIDTAACAGKIIDVHGQRGIDWLKDLPALLAGSADHWALTILPPFPYLSYNYVTPVIGPGDVPLVLKAGVPHPELWSEIEALKFFDGRGAVRLITADPEKGLLLLERVRPGHPLNRITNDEDRITALVGVMRRLWRPLPANHPFRTIADLARGLDRVRATFGGGYGPFPPVAIERARAIFREIARGGNDLLIHGDMNPGNVLRAEREPWLAIDPKGYAGHPLFDVATFLNDPPEGFDEARLPRSQNRRVSLLAEALSVTRTEVLAWAEAHAVLSGWWSFEDHGKGWEQSLSLAELYGSWSQNSSS